MKIVCFILLLLPMLSVADTDCDDATTTRDMTTCVASQIEQAEIQMQRYLQAALTHYKDNTLLRKTLINGQYAWQHYQQAHCRSVAMRWQGGSIAPLIELSCQKKMIQQRTYQVWQDFLRAEDGGSAVLPAPAMPED